MKETNTIKMKFETGFRYRGFWYGWHGGDLYRLPTERGNRLYGLRRLPVIKVGNHIGYYVARVKMSMNVVKARTTIINKNIKFVL